MKVVDSEPGMMEFEMDVEDNKLQYSVGNGADGEGGEGRNATVEN